MLAPKQFVAVKKLRFMNTRPWLTAYLQIMVYSLAILLVLLQIALEKSKISLFEELQGN